MTVYETHQEKFTKTKMFQSFVFALHNCTIGTASGLSKFVQKPRNNLSQQMLCKFVRDFLGKYTSFTFHMYQTPINSQLHQLYQW